MNNKYKFDKSDLNNIISLTNASYFQMRLYKDKDVKYTFAIQPTENGQAILTITDDLIDEPIEVGDYDFQISLLDADKSSMISMPIARQQLHVCEPLVSNESKTGSAVLGLSQLDTTGEIIDAFDENGNYIRKVHVNGETISAELFNKWETALESNTTNIVEVKNNQINLSKDITNLSLAIGDDGLLYIKKRNGTLIGTGVKVNTDLSNITMSLNANTLILSNNGTQIASVDLPSSVSDADVSNLITKGVSETNYNALDATDKRIIGGINEINTHLNGTAKKTIVEGNKIYLVKSDGTKLDKGTELPTSEPAKPYDDTAIKKDINDLKSKVGTETLTTTAKDLKGAINEVNKKLSDIPTLFTTEQTDDYYKIKYNNIVIATIPLNSSTPTPTTKYSITNNLSHATNSNSATSIEKNASYNATITANSNYRIKTVTVIMYGTDITDTVYSGGRITIDNVVGDIVITVTTELISGGDEDLSKLDGILKGRLLVWHDEFDDAALDTTKWRYATHNSGGSEQQAYTIGRTENVRLENSNLILEARKDSTSWTNAVDNTKLQWKVANNNSPDIAAYMKFDGNSFYWEGTNYKDHLTLDGFKNYYDFGESQTVILAGDFTNVLNPIISNKAKLSQNANLACMNSNGITYSDASGKRIGAINLSTSEQNYNINGCISLRYNKQTLRVDTDTMEFTGSTINNKNVTLSSAFTQGSYPALLGNVSTAKAYFKVVLVYNRVLTDAEIGTTMNAITTFLNS